MKHIDSISVVVPVFSDGASLAAIAKRISSAMKLHDIDYELIFVDDCANEKAWGKIIDLSMRKKSIKGIKMARNFGQHNATLCGIRFANKPYIVTLDDDLQHPPEEIMTLINEIENNSNIDLVWAIPFRQNHSLLRKLFVNTTKYILMHSFDVNHALNFSSFRLFKTSLRSSFERYNGTWAHVDLLLSWATNSISSVKINHHLRLNGSSSYNLMMLINHTLNLLIGFSSLPLRISILVGFLFAILSFFILIYLLCLKIIYGSVVPGFLFIASLITFFFGFQFLFLGIIGEYISRIHIGVLGQTSYHVRETVNFENY